MALFPTDRGSLPESLNWLNPRHYFLLAYWVYFRPTALHAYLEKAAPELQRASGWQKFRQSARIRGYRNLYLIALLATALFSIFLILTASLYVQYSLQGHTAAINDIAVTPNHQFAVTVSGDREIKYGLPSGDPSLKVWDVDQGSEIYTLKGHSRDINTVAITPDGKKAVSGSSDATLRLWNIQKGASLGSLKGHKRTISDIVITPDGQKAISASFDNTLKIWDLKTKKALHTLTGHTDFVRDIVLTPDGNRVVSAADDGTLKIWDISQGQEVRTLTGHQSRVNAAAITPDGKFLISASADKTVKVWNVSTGTLLHTLTGHQAWVNAIAATSDSQLAISASSDRTLKVWDLQTGTLRHTLTGHQGWVNAVAVTPNNQQAISASSDHTLRVWDLQAGRQLHTLKGHSGWVKTVAVISDQQAISASYDRFPKVWDLKSGKVLAKATFQRKRILLIIGLGITSILTVAAAISSFAAILALSILIFGIIGSLSTLLILTVIVGGIYSISVVLLDRIVVHPAFKDVAFAEGVSLGLVIIVGVGFGSIFSTAFSLGSRKSLGVFGSILFMFAAGLACGIIIASVVQRPASSLIAPLITARRVITQVSFIFNGLVAIGALRLAIYPIEWVWAFWSHTRGHGHPVEWDELVVLPLPKTRNLLLRRLQRDELTGLNLVLDVNRNPFQRSVVQSALHAYLHQSPAPLHLLYGIITRPEFNTYVLPPITQQDWRLFPTQQQLVLGQLANQWVDCSSDWPSQLSENWVGCLTRFQRTQRQTPLTEFAAMLYRLLYETDMDAADFDLSVYHNTYTRLISYPGGAEITNSFEALAAFLSYDHLSALPAATYFRITNGEREPQSHPEAEATDLTAIRPTVVTALTHLGEIAAEVAVYQEAESPTQQMAALAKAIALLNTLEQFVITEVAAPEQALLRRVIRQWRQLMIVQQCRIV